LGDPMGRVFSYLLQREINDLHLSRKSRGPEVNLLVSKLKALGLITTIIPITRERVLV